MAEITEVQPQQDTVSIEKFSEDLSKLVVAYNKTLESLSKVQESSAPSENAMFKITLSNMKRPVSYVLTEDEKAADTAAIMDFVESRQELISAQGVTFKALQLLQSKQTVLINHVNKINMELEKKLSELNNEVAPAESSPPAPSRAPK